MRWNSFMQCTLWWYYNVQRGKCAISFQPLSGRLFLNSLIIFSHICWQTGDSLPIFALRGISLLWILLLFQAMIQICWHHLFEIILLFYAIASPKHVPTFFGMCCRPEIQKWTYMKGLVWFCFVVSGVVWSTCSQFLTCSRNQSERSVPGQSQRLSRRAG